MTCSRLNSLLCGLLRRIWWCFYTNVSEDYAAAIFRVEVCREQVDIDVDRVRGGGGVRWQHGPPERCYPTIRIHDVIT